MKVKTGAKESDLRKAIKVELRKKVIATALVKRSDHKRYEGLITSLGQDYALGTNKYPDTIDKALTVLNASQNPTWTPSWNQPTTVIQQDWISYRVVKELQMMRLFQEEEVDWWPPATVTTAAGLVTTRPFALSCPHRMWELIMKVILQEEEV